MKWNQLDATGTKYIRSVCEVIRIGRGRKEELKPKSIAQWLARRTLWSSVPCSIPTLSRFKFSLRGTSLYSICSGSLLSGLREGG